jgi:acetyl esterase/lipase
MRDRDPLLARRTIVKGAGLGLVAGALGDTTAAQSSECVIGMSAPKIWSSEYWANKGDIPLWMYRKRLGEPKPGEPSRPVLFFVHGS